MRLPISVSMLVIFLLGSAGLPARDCGDSERFAINSDGTVTDIDAGLTWMRCSLGQHWDGSDCQGQAVALSWSTARERIEELNDRDGQHWRLPRLNELATLADQHCRLPRLDLGLFPGTPAAPYWSATLVRSAEAEAYSLDFGARGVQRTPLAGRHYIRLVRGREAP